MNLFLAITLYDGKIHGRCSLSILKNCLSLMKAGHTITPHYNNDLYIDLSRNFCINLFLESDCNDIIFIDSDLEFDDDAILKLIKHNKDIVAGVYRLKQSVEEYSTILDFDIDINCKEESTGLVRAKLVPAGLLRINRSVFEKMIDCYHMIPDKKDIYPFFATGMIFPNDNSWYGEDAYFCKRWRAMGGQIFVEPRITFNHIGSQDFKGNYHEYLLGRQVEKIDWDEKLSGIPGWMCKTEQELLKYLASKCDSVVEVGCWKGRTTKKLLESCKGTVYAVDHWQGSLNDGAGFAIHLSDVYSDFLNNVGHYPNLKILKGSSINMAQSFNGKMIDMVFIDAGHTYEECRSDIEVWLPKCRKIIAGHDYRDGFPGVIQAVNEKFSKINLLDSIWWVEL